MTPASVSLNMTLALRSGFRIILDGGEPIAEQGEDPDLEVGAVPPLLKT